MKVVKSWDDITVGQYQEMMTVETENELSRFIECMAIALDCDPEDIRNKPFSEWSEIRKDFQFISGEPSGNVEEIIKIDDIEYGIEPDMNMITTGVFIDAEQFKQEPIINLHRTLALIYRPITKTNSDGTYEIEPHKNIGFEKRANLFKERLSPNVAIGATLFFSIIGMELSILSLDSLILEVEKQNLMNGKTIQIPTKKPKQKRSKKVGVSTIK